MGIHILSLAVHKMKFKKISFGKFFQKSSFCLRSTNIDSKVWLLDSLTREIVSATSAQAMKNLQVSTITALIKSVLISMCVWSSLFVLIHWTLISSWILAIQLSKIFCLKCFFMNNISLNMNVGTWEPWKKLGFYFRTKFYFSTSNF